MINQKKPTIDDVATFWENNPLWQGESEYETGSKEFFEEHRDIYIQDCFAGNFDERFLPSLDQQEHILDCGCGPGFWTVELLLRGAKSIVAADLTGTALKLCERRLKIYGLKADYIQANAEGLPIKDSVFTYVNCAGVVHHTTKPEKCIQEISRVLIPGGGAFISVYYKNIVLRNWRWLRTMRELLFKIGAKMRGRGRENILLVDNIDEIVRMYDGVDNPIGLAYSKKEFISMLEPYFHINNIYGHFFPARSIPFKIPIQLHRGMERLVPFMIAAKLEKKG